MVIDNDMTETQDFSRHYTPIPIYSRSDVHFPLTTPRKRAPSVASMADIVEKDGQSVGRLTIKASDASPSLREEEDQPLPPRRSIHDLPLEVQGKILDFIFGDLHSVNTTSTSLRGKSVASLMRHPRRKAVSELALVCEPWRLMVQERIYRHIKIKGTRSGLEESVNFFGSHDHLVRLVRHIEFWVPVWGDKTALVNDESIDILRHNRIRQPLDQADDGLIQPDFLAYTFKLAAQTATLSEIFRHIDIFFPFATIFSLEGGHCKKSNMIRHFPSLLFPPESSRHLSVLSNIRTFAMRGAWNIMRQYSDFINIQTALPNVEEWHCSYAKPRPEADLTINQILLHIPLRLRHVNISLDGMYSKDPSTLPSSHPHTHPHLCERLGTILPQLESLSFTGKVCECLWTSALASLPPSQESRLTSLEIVVKSCCRQRVQTTTATGENVVEELGGVMADGAGITNLIFIKAFERLVLHTVDALDVFAGLKYVRIRFIDLDSPCTLLNPYWLLENNRVYGVWNEEIVERLGTVRGGALGYVELGEGIETDTSRRKEWENPLGAVGGGSGVGTAVGAGAGVGGALHTGIPRREGRLEGNGAGEPRERSVYPRFKPRSIKTSSYRIVAETRGA